MKTFSSFSVFASLVLVIMAGGTGCSPQQSITIDGSSTVQPITQAVEESYRDEQTGCRITIAVSGTGGGMKKFSVNEIDIADASRPMKDKELAACKKNGVEYVRFMVAFDGLAVLVNPKNDWCDSLTVSELKSIWEPESKVNTWKDIRPEWPDEEIKLFGPGPDSGTFDSFTKAICGKERSSRSDFTASEEDNVLVTGVAQTKNALGYFGYAYYAENTDKLKLLGVDNEKGDGPVKPSEATVRDNSYTPLSRPLFIYVNKASLKREEVANFVKFYIDNTGKLSPEVGYVPVSEEEAEENQRLYKEVVAEVNSNKEA